MSVYKITCETGKVYYGSTGNTLKRRKEQGWYNCACKDFINPVVEELHSIEDKSKRLLKENYYIDNFKCVNINRAVGMTMKERNKFDYMLYGEDRKEANIAYRKMVVEEKRHYCSLCDFAYHTPLKLTRHKEGYRHQLKQKSYDKYGEDWKKYYLEDNKARYDLKRGRIPKNKNN